MQQTACTAPSEDNGIIQGNVLGVKELGSKGVKTIALILLGVQEYRSSGVQTIV
jgi:hypothetical protein